MSLLVTACDLTMCGKPWPVNKEVAATLYEEFYTQVGSCLLVHSHTYTLLHVRHRASLPCLLSLNALTTCAVACL